jgi:hypothetical protein
MQQFVLIFRKGSGGEVSAEESSRRTVAIKAWAKRWTDKGYVFDPRGMGPEIYRLGSDGDKDEAAENRILNLLFFNAKDFDDAVRVAKTHPGLEYGRLIEVRAWAAPSGPAKP